MAMYPAVRSQVQTVARGLAHADIDRDDDLRPLHIGGAKRLAIARRHLAVLGDLDVAEPNREPVAVGRLARLAHGHDDAAPIRVLAGDRRLHQRRIGDGQRDPPRRGGALGAGDAHRDEFGRPLAVLHHLVREIAQHLGERGAEAREPRIVRQAQFAARPATRPLPVANSSSVSLVEVSPSMVMALKVSSAAGASISRNGPGSIAASVKRKASMVAMSGAIMPAPLAMPLMVTGTPSISAWRVASFG